MTSLSSPGISRRHFLKLAGSVSLSPAMYTFAGTGDTATIMHQGPAREFIEGIPKAELHVHLEGTVDPDMAIGFASRNGISLPYATADELKAALNFNSLEAFLKAFDLVISTLRTREDFYETTYRYLERCHSQNVVYVDLMFDPQAHQRRGIPFGDVINGIHDARADARQTLGIHSQVIMNFQRDAPLQTAEAAYEASLEHRDKIVGIGLDNTEVRDFPEKFSELFARARAEGFMLTSHCDLGQPNSIEHIRACIEDLKVNRLDHGYNILEDDRLVNLALEKQLCFTACPTTDFATTDPAEKFYFSRVSASVKQMLDRGLRVTINTDDPGVMGNRHLNQVLFEMATYLSLREGEVVLLMENAFNSLWITAEIRQNYLARLHDYTRRG